MNFDGSKMLEGLGAGVVLTSPKGDKLQLFSFLRCSLAGSRLRAPSHSWLP
jgi:hypothetical protein